MVKKRELDAHYRRMQSWSIREGKVFQWLEPLPKDAKILKIGCGSGYFASELISAGFSHVRVIDNGDFIAYPDVRERCDFKSADLSFESIGYPDGYFDAVIALQVLEHVENPWHAVRECERVLRKGGMFIVTVPRADALPYRWSYLVRRTPDAFHRDNNDVNFFIPELWSRLFPQEKWRTISTEYSTSFIRLSRSRKIRLPDIPFWGRLFARRIGFILEKLR